MNIKNSPNQITIYEGKNGPVKLNVDIKKQIIWATQAEMAEIFGVNSQAITKHLKKIYAVNELEKESTCSILEQVRNEGNRKVKRILEVYNLDAIISVGYRVNSIAGTSFRRWANTILKDYIIKGYAINRNLIKKNYQLFQNAVDDIKQLLPANDNSMVNGVLEIIKAFAYTWVSLDAYDKSSLPEKGGTLRKIDISAEELQKYIAELKKELNNNKTATKLFAIEREEGSLNGILRSIYQSLGGHEPYASVEEKVANLLYLIIKNHPFIDGNKRTGAFSFLWFLKKAGILNTLKISPEVLTTLTIFIAESKMGDKDKMVGIVLMLLK
ncbi:MAG: RhuM family protein [bacterium]